MDSTVEEVLFETRRHASRPFSTNYPPQQQLNEAGGRSLLSYLPFRGITQLKDKWRGYRQPRRLRRSVSLFVSARGDYVAVASRNQITILQKDNDYQEPVGTFTCWNASSFTFGTWCEPHELLGVADDTGTIYIIKPNGEEVARITEKQLNVSSPVVGLIVQHDDHENKSYLCTLTIFLSDGSFHDIEISKDPSASISAAQSMKNVTLLTEFSRGLCCWDYHPKVSLFAFVSSAGDIKSTSNGSTGSCMVSLWRRKKNLEMEPVVFTNFEGLYSIAEGYTGQVTSPKVLLSPQGNFLATLDMKGCLFSFKFDEEKRSLSKVPYCMSCNSEEISDISINGVEILHDIVDFTWWSDCILTIAKRDGTITMVGILSHVDVLQGGLIYSMPLLERAQKSPGLIFLLEYTSPGEKYISSEQQKCTNLIDPATLERHDQFDLSKLKWSLVSLTKRSVVEIYDKLISSQRYDAALDFSVRHGLDKDEVLKSRWLSSVQGVHEINTILPSIKDLGFIISECENKVGPTEDAVRALLSLGLRLTDSYRFTEPDETDDGEIWTFRLARLRLLQLKDRLETFIGINMGRFSVREYSSFRDLPIRRAASTLAEGGKIGALNLLFKRHPYSLVPCMLDVLAAIPETIPVQTYGQLLPAISAPSNMVIRDEDWVECEKMATFMNNQKISIQIMTEPMLKKHMVFQWPGISELSSWYKKRARDIDTLSGQLDNCMCLVDFAIHKGISDLQQFFEDINYLHQLIYSNDDEIEFSMSFVAWEQLPDYEKFKSMLRGVKEDNVIPRLHKKAIPFMQRKLYGLAPLSGDEVTIEYPTQDTTVDSYLVRWLKEIAAQNKLDICLIIFEEACNNLANNHFFKNKVEMVDCAIHCIYLCADIDRWNTMSTILSKLPQMRDLEDEDIKQRLKHVEGHVEAGRLMAYYQVPKPMSFFLDADLDDKGVKQILRLLLSKFMRWQPGRTDHDWANMWRDLQSLQEKAFSFLDIEYILMEFCRGLLKAGKFSLARNYLKGTSSVALAADKAEYLIIQAAREYFFSAPSLACPEIWKAKECLTILPSSRNVRAEADIIDAVTEKLPSLGVNILPMAFKQIKDPMEIIKLAISSQNGAYLNVDELIEIAKCLGLSSQEEISTVQEAIAREAAFAGDVQLAFDLCLVLAKKGHGSVWDLCAALARSQALETMDSKSQKLLLGFALSHCDEESIGELLNEWKDLDMQDHCDTLVTLTGKEPSEFSEQTLNKSDWPGKVAVSFEDQEAHITKLKSLLSLVAENLSSENEYDWESLLRENTKVASFAASQLPWLLELSEDIELGKRLTLGSGSTIQNVSVRARAVMVIISWVTRNGFTPRDDLIASLAKSIMEPPVSDEEDILGGSVLLNLTDAFGGAQIIQEQLRTRENYHEFSNLMNVGMMYCLLHSCGIECENPAQRRELLQLKFQEKHKPLSSDECNNLHEVQSTFWNEWKVKLEQQKHVADKSRVLEKLIPGVKTSLFFSGDTKYIQDTVFSLIESVKLEKKQIRKDALDVARTYGLDHNKVLLHYLRTILVSEVWSVDEVREEISEFKGQVLACAEEAIKAISLDVYPAIDGHDKVKLSYIYGLLYDCHVWLAESKDLPLAVSQDPLQTSTLGLARFFDIVGKECSKVSFIKGLNFKNIAGLEDLNLSSFNSEVCAHIDEKNVEALASMVQNLILLYGETVPEGLLSWKYVYTHYVLSSFATLEDKTERESHFQSSEDLFLFIEDIEQVYGICRKYIQFLEFPGVLDIVKRFFTVILLINRNLGNFPCDSTGKECLLKLTGFWLRLMNEMEELVLLDSSVEKLCSKCSMTCLTVFLSLLVNGTVSPTQYWGTIVYYIGYGLESNVAVETFNFCRAMIFCGCGFQAISHVFSEVMSQLPPGSVLNETTPVFSINIQDLTNLYLSILGSILHEIASGSLKRQSLHYLVSSLSKLEGDLEDLRKVRIAVWGKMSTFSENLQLPSQLRVYTLELMQFLSGRKRNLDLFSSEGPSHLRPWEDWDDLVDGTTNLQTTSDDPSSKEVSSRYTNTLVALKSTQLVSSISPDLEITPEDIHSVDAAVSCFLRVSDLATTTLHIDSLVSVLTEWEGLFTAGINEASATEESDVVNWGNDDWDEGWESFQEESVEKESKKAVTNPIHPLHICWSTVIKKLVMFSSHKEILRLLDQYGSKNCGTLLDEDDTRILIQTTLEMDCFLALKVALLLPYEAIQMQCLDAVESKLKEVGISDNISQDYLFFVLILSSGLLSTIITKASYGTTFSCLCFMVGNFCRQFQETQASKIEHVGSTKGEKNKENFNLLFVKLLFPCFIADLVKVDQHILAGFLVTKFIHTNASLSLINISDTSLKSYLERLYQDLEESKSSWEDTSFYGPLSVTINNLRGEMENLIQSALSLLPTDVR